MGHLNIDALRSREVLVVVGRAPILPRATVNRCSGLPSAPAWVLVGLLFMVGCSLLWQ